MSRTYGTLRWVAAKNPRQNSAAWHLTGEPHIKLRAKRVFEKLYKNPGAELGLSDTPENCRDLLWFLDRYPLEISADDLRRLKRGSKRHADDILTLEKIIGSGHVVRNFAHVLALPPRDYQRQAAEVYLHKRCLLLADDVGLGKTVSAIASLVEPKTLPACVVTLAGAMPAQWAAEIKRFAPWLTVHVLTKGKAYPLPEIDGRKPDVVVLNYHKLHGWSDVLAQYCRSVIFDEAQELRRTTSDKYAAARHIARHVHYRLGLTATPIYNYGSEMFAVVDCLAPGELGTAGEFAREWCGGDGSDTAKVKYPKALGSFLRENFLMLRRTRADVGRELPPLSKVPYAIDSDRAALDAVEGTARELAKIILSGHGEAVRGEKMQAAEELSNVVRQATGIAKAPHVADFVRLIVESGEPVVLYGWHRAVYAIWKSKLADLNPVWYTGDETAKQKAEAREAFVSGKSPLLIMSLRAGAGLDGLQQVSATAVFGELDWSPGVHEQCVGRVYRDGQPKPVMAYYLIAEEGSDPLVAEVLGVKREQVEGLRNPHDESLERLQNDGGHIRALAERYLTKQSAA